MPEHTMNEQQNTPKVRTRIAPSPTGDDIHIGNLYTALINFAVAQRNGGEFIIRIEDTDRTRFREGAEEKILTSIRSFGLSYDEGPDVGGPFAPYRQSERLSIYKEHAELLLNKGAAYYCFCTKERLDDLRESQQKEKKTPRYDKYCLTHVTNAEERIANGEPYVIRLNVKQDEVITFQDLIRGEISISSNEVDDQVLLKSDGYPTYHLGVVVDDHLMKISHIIRAEEWISSTPKHILLYQAFGWELPIFAHLPILRNPDKSKLSKRKNPVWASWYLEEGFLPEAVLNYLALLGWSHPKEKEIFTLDEFINTFRLEDINVVGPVFDLTKLTWMNQQYIQNLENDSLKDRLLRYYKNDEIMVDLLTHNAFVDDLLSISKTRLKTLKEFKPLVISLVEPPDKSALNEDHFAIAPRVREALDTIPDAEWNQERIFETLKPILEERSIKMPVFYVLFTGNKHGLPLPHLLEMLTKEETIRRLNDLVS